jgi:branched-subunit amino acid aminotransferase/4-amino-4-deoxychorismate lyase
MTKAGGEFAPWMGVFETLRVVQGVPLFMSAHLRELGRAMAALGLASDFDFEQARAELPRLNGRWRWIVTAEGTRTQFTEEEWVPTEPMELSVAAVRVGSCNWDARFKTLSYLTHAQAWKMKSTDEVILLNEYGLMASAARANLFWRFKGQLFTPAHETGCRRGTVRAFISRHHNVRSGHFPASDLLEAEEIFLTSSLRGIVSVGAVKGRTYKRYLTADDLRAEYEEEIARQVAEAQAGA